ncbi:TrmB family transcriptional regulator sugar-binding domain-containing protein [Streptomyces sp. NPDC017546]|uniref:TrmB family transcriptional regulator sugar-binding domain-containing protein n=1 Tax=Streptomyces sp. NPDC017546 TaxID=3365001 RepID=UPI0037A9220C
MPMPLKRTDFQASMGQESELGHALLQVQALIESTIAIQRDRSTKERLITSLDGDYEVILDTAGELIRSATRGIDILHARPPRPGELDEMNKGRGEEPERELIYGANERVSVRLLTTPSMLDEEYVREQRDKEYPAAIRVARLPPLQALIVDGRTALVVADSAAGRYASLIRLPEMLNTLSIHFESVWRNAAPAWERIAFNSWGRAELARRILSALRAGVTDEVAARELSVSVRTYRRYVAEIMVLLGATSRFQAGVRAAKLGLLPPPPSRSDAGGAPYPADSREAHRQLPETHVATGCPGKAG